MLYMHQKSHFFSFFLFPTVSTLKKQKWRKTPELGTFLKDTHQPGASSRTSILNLFSYIATFSQTDIGTNRPVACQVPRFNR